MDNEKRILIAVALSIAVLFIYQYLFTPPPKKTEPATRPAAEQMQAQPPAPVAVQPKAAPETIKPAALPQAAAVDESAAVTVESDFFTALFASSSGGPKSFRLHNYRESLEPSAAERLMQKLLSSGASALASPDQKYKELIHAASTQDLPLRTFFVDSGSSVLTASAWQADRAGLKLDDAARSGSITFSQQDQQGLKVTKQFAFTDRDYKIGFNLSFKNDATTARMGNPVIEWKTPVPSQHKGGFFNRDTSNTVQFTYLLKDKVVKQDVANIKEDTPIEGDILWTAIEEKYFTSALLMQEQKPAQVRVGKSSDGMVTYQVLFPAIALQPGQEAQYRLQLYMGPKDMDILAQQGAHLEKTLDFGWFDIIAKPLLMCLKFFYGFLGNYGLAIILLTIIIKVLFWPLTHKSFQSMKGMQKIQPELAALKEKYKDNKDEFARQQLALYRKYNVNPLSGCLPIVIQIPVFIALYNALMYSIELRHASFIAFWINDLRPRTRPI